MPLSIEARLGLIEQRLAVLEVKREPTAWIIGWDQIAKYLAMPRRSAMRWRAAGFPALRLGRTVRTSPALVESWLLNIEQRRLSGAIPKYTERRDARNSDDDQASCGRRPPSARGF